ncbi:MAG: hypothetical protein IJ589_00120 [Lachnospiraceae bacterium]|nr:hypothetical protein [Lachnospiraceae bacterium]
MKSNSFELLPYRQEPLDTKLVLLLILRKWWVFLLTSVFGILLVGGGYYLRYVVFAGPANYETTTDVRIEYVKPADGSNVTIFNQVTWGQLIQDNVFTDPICEAMEDDKTGSIWKDYTTGLHLTKEDINAWVTGTLLSDERIVTVTVKTPSKELTEEISAQLMKGFLNLVSEMPELRAASLIGQSTAATESFRDVRVLRACILGLVLFDLAAALIIWLLIVSDDSVYVPVTFERRYGIPMLGGGHNPSFDALTKQLLGDEITVLFMGGSPMDAEGLQKRINASDATVVDMITVGKDRDKELCTRLREAKNLLLAVPSGAHNGKQIEEILSLCEKSGAEIKAAVLHPADEKLLDTYLGLNKVIASEKRKKK